MAVHIHSNDAVPVKERAVNLVATGAALLQKQQRVVTQGDSLHASEVAGNEAGDPRVAPSLPVPKTPPGSGGYHFTPNLLMMIFVAVNAQFQASANYWLQTYDEGTTHMQMAEFQAKQAGQASQREYMHRSAMSGKEADITGSRSKALLAGFIVTVAVAAVPLVKASYTAIRGRSSATTVNMQNNSSTPPPTTAATTGSSGTAGTAATSPGTGAAPTTAVAPASAQTSAPATQVNATEGMSRGAAFKEIMKSTGKGIYEGLFTILTLKGMIDGLTLGPSEFYKSFKLGDVADLWNEIGTAQAETRIAQSDGEYSRVKMKQYDEETQHARQVSLSGLQALEAATAAVVETAERVHAIRS